MADLILRKLSRLGARLGNWNDRQFGPELGRHPRRGLWRRIDRVAGRLHVLGDQVADDDR